MAIGTSGEYYSYFIRPIVTRKVCDLEKQAYSCAMYIYIFNVHIMWYKKDRVNRVVGLINRFFNHRVFLFRELFTKWDSCFKKLLSSKSH